MRNITAGTFAGLVSLTKLDLSTNNITFIDEDAFAEMSKLRTLYLERNRIQIVGAKWFDPVSHPALYKVQIGTSSEFKLNHNHILAENNWDCGCEASNFRHFIEVTGNAERFEQLVDEPVLNCTSPTQMIGQYLAGMPIRRGSKTNFRTVTG